MDNHLLIGVFDLNNTLTISSISEWLHFSSMKCGISVLRVFVFGDTGHRLNLSQGNQVAGKKKYVIRKRFIDI